MPRNSVMKEALSAAGLKVVNPEVEQRAARIKTRFNKRFPNSPNVEPDPPEEEAPTLQLVPSTAPILSSPTPIPYTPPPPPPPPISASLPVPALTVPTLPPDLAWLVQPGPCGDSLTNIVNNCRDARTYLGFELENATKRERERQVEFDRARAELDAAQQVTLGIRCQLEAIKDTIDTCCLIADTTKKISALSRISSGSSHKTPRNNPCVCKRTDVLAILESDKDHIWSAAELTDRLPEIKRASGRVNIPALLSTLHNEGKVVRASKGRYRTAF